MAVIVHSCLHRCQSAVNRGQSLPRMGIGDSGGGRIFWADVNLKNEGGRTALHYAASKGSFCNTLPT
ncbi:26S proteasome non-ATPase regulatory subunit 10 [Tanacetum coccineum]